MAKGDVVEGTVKRLTDFGAFVVPGIDGLVHVSQISHKRIEIQALTVGQELLLKYSMLTLTQNQHLLSKLLKNVQLKKEGQRRKTCCSSTSPKRVKKKRDF